MFKPNAAAGVFVYRFDFKRYSVPAEPKTEPKSS